MTAVLYGNFRVDLLDQHGTRVDRRSLAVPVPPLRFRDLGPPPRPGTELLGRSGLLGNLARVARPGWAVELQASCGFGKSSLLAALAANLAATNAAPVVTVRVGSPPAEDVLDQVFGALYTASPPVKPSPEQRRTLLGQTRAIVVLDDVSLAPEQVTGILAALPQCLVLVGAERGVVGAEGLSVALAGLDEEASLQLLARDLGRALEKAERHDAARLCAAVQGQPLRLRQAAALAAAGRVSLGGLAARAEHDPRVLDRLTVNALGDAERRVLGVLALAGGAVLPGDLVEVLCAIGDLSGELGRLRRRGLVEEDPDRFGLPRCLAGGYRQLLLSNLQVGASVRPLISWLGQRDPTSSDALAGANAAVEMLAVLAERAEWGELAHLAEVTSRVLTLAGRWEACRRVLEEGLEAARQVGDPLAQARFRHDLGSIQLCSDDLRQAESQLSQALELRKRHGDREGAAVTRHNLDLLSPLEPPPPNGSPSPGLVQRLRAWAQRVRRRVPALLSLASVFALLIVLILRTFAFPTTRKAVGPTTRSVGPTTATTVTTPPTGTARPPGSTGPTGARVPGFAAPSGIRFPSTPVGGSATQVIDVTSTGTAPLRLSDFELEGDHADFTADRHCRNVLVPPGRSCQITLRFTPTAQGNRTATLIIHQNLPGPASRIQLAGTGLPSPQRRSSLAVEVQAGTDLQVTSEPPGIDCPAVCEATFPDSTTVTLQATTKSGAIVWERDCAGAVDACTLRLDADRNVLVRLEPLPDLVPSGPRLGTKGELIVTVTNQGKGDAAASRTDVVFGPYGSVSIATPALPSGASADLSTAIPSRCYDPDCDFMVVVDAADQLRESDEGNNSLSDSFLG